VNATAAGAWRSTGGIFIRDSLKHGNSSPGGSSRLFWGAIACPAEQCYNIEIGIMPIPSQTYGIDAWQPFACTWTHSFAEEFAF
jgi:hypothetical protein